MSDKKECSGEMIPANINDILEKPRCSSASGLFPCQNVKNELNIKESLCFIWSLKEFYVSLHRE